MVARAHLQEHVEVRDGQVEDVARMDRKLSSKKPVLPKASSSRGLNSADQHHENKEGGKHASRWDRDVRVDHRSDNESNLKDATHDEPKRGVLFDLGLRNARVNRESTKRNSERSVPYQMRVDVKCHVCIGARIAQCFAVASSRFKPKTAVHSASSRSTRPERAST